MEKSHWLGPALFSIVAGLLGVTLIPFQQSCPPEPLAVQCSGYVTPALDLALLYASGSNHRRDCDARSAHVSMGKSEKIGKVILRTLSRSLRVSLCLLKSILSAAAPQIAHLIPDAFSRADGRDSDRRFQ